MPRPRFYDRTPRGPRWPEYRHNLRRLGSAVFGLALLGILAFALYLPFNP